MRTLRFCQQGTGLPNWQTVAALQSEQTLGPADYVLRVTSHRNPLEGSIGGTQIGPV